MSSKAHPPGCDRLSVRLRRGTRTVHDEAERSGFLDALAEGRLPREAYADLTAQHYLVYEELERAAAAMAHDPVASAFISRDLARLPSLEADLAFLHGRRWRNRIAALPATTTYRTRLRGVVTSGAPRFLAHHYTRYLGDLSGGQYLGSAIARSYELCGDGHRFFVFPGVDPAAFKARYRRRLDTVPWSPAEQATFLAEAVEAYRLNIAILAELAESWA
jgi:heme oxygenase